MIYKVIYKIQKLGVAHEQPEGISRAEQEEAWRERAMTNPITPQGTLVLSWMGAQHFCCTLWDLDMQV